MARDAPWTPYPHALEPPDGAVALTFDDGPDPRFTPKVLDQLERLGVVATFFLVGERARAQPELVRRIAEAGHAVGSHSYSHPEPWTVPPLRLVGQYSNGRRAVESVLGRRTRLFRPPKGFVGRRRRLAIVLARVKPWLWTIDTEDWRPGVTSDGVAATTDDLRAGDVLLLHDGICLPLSEAALDRSATVEAIPRIVERARQRGLGLVALPA